jgi:adenylosuccinate lyase
MLARTHGQPAEPITLGVRLGQWASLIAQAIVRWQEAMREVRTGKLSGPVGSYAHNPVELERAVLTQFRLYRANATQVVARDSLAAWASATASVVSACGAIATDFRLMAARGEVAEQFRAGQVGSSSMPHKQNPITAEKINGLVWLARGYAQMLQPFDLWEDRDISHSCVERVAVPDLLHVLCHALRCTHELISGAQWNTQRMSDTLENWDRVPYTAWATLRGVRGGLTRKDAEREAVEWTGDDNDPRYQVPGWLSMVQNHPVVAHSTIDTEASRKVG